MPANNQIVFLPLNPKSIHHKVKNSFSVEDREIKEAQRRGKIPGSSRFGFSVVSWVCDSLVSYSLLAHPSLSLGSLAGKCWGAENLEIVVLETESGRRC